MFPTILQLDIAGNPQQWIDFETSAYHYAKGNVGWSMGETEFDIFGGTNAVSGKRSRLTINTIIAIKGVLNTKAMNHYNRVPLSNNTLFRRDMNLCGYCGTDVAAGNLTRDHIHPTSRGGKNVWVNVITACKNCNKAKGYLTPEEANMPLLFVPYVPSRAEWLLLQNRNVLVDQMAFLLKRVPKESRLHNYN